MPPIITTPRLHLRLWKPADLPVFAAMNADPRVMEFYPDLLSRAESDAMAERIRQSFPKNGFGLWAVEAPGVADFLGFVGLSIPRFESPFTPCVEIGWRLGYDHWGRGYATEAARAVLRHGFGPLGLQEIVSFTAVNNIRSRAVMERIGLRRQPERDFDHPLLSVGHRLRPHVFYSADSSMFPAAPAVDCSL